MLVEVLQITQESDLKKAFSIRREVFVEGQGVPAEEEYDSYDSTAQHYMLLVNGEMVGTARWRFTDNGIKLERFAVLDSYRNKGLGSKLLKKVLMDLPTGQKVYLHAQLKAVPLYERQGFKKVGDLFLECDIEHYKMTWAAS